MTTATLSSIPSTRAVPYPAPGRAVRRLARRHLRRGTVAVAALCGSLSGLFAAQFPAISRALDEAGMHDIAGNPLERLLLGPPLALDDAGGFSVWRTGTAVLVVAGGWVALAATRVTRGEEDTGRWALLLGGRLTLVDVVARHLAAVAGAATLIGAGVAAGLLAARTDPAGALTHAAGVTGVGLTAATSGLLAAQIMPTRGRAAGVTVSALGVGLLLRMLADSSPHLSWLAWATPFGLAARAAPYAGNRIVPLLVLGVFPAALAGVALIVARNRDLGDGILSASQDRSPRTRLIRSVTGFAVGRAGRPTAAWAVGVGAAFVLAGAMLASVLQYVSENPKLAELAAAAGTSGLSSANAFSAPLFSMLALPTGLYAALRLATMVADEKAGRWTPLLAAPVPRARLAGVELAVTAAGVIVLHCCAGIAMWVGATLTGAPLRAADALAGALNSAPVALLAAGAAAVGVGWLPSATGAIGALPVIGGFLVSAALPAVDAPGWIAELSPWTHLAAVPAAPPHWTGIGWLLVTGAGMAALGVRGYAQRDVAT